MSEAIKPVTLADLKGTTGAGSAQHVFITAEIGINHNGDMALCKELIDW